MAWVMVSVAGLFETGFAVLLKQSQGVTRLWPTVGFAACALISFGLPAVALRKLEVGPAYAVWTGLGAAGTAVVGTIGQFLHANVLTRFNAILGVLFVLVMVAGPPQGALFGVVLAVNTGIGVCSGTAREAGAGQAGDSDRGARPGAARRRGHRDRPGRGRAR